MSDPAAQPWWADVQHLRPREDGGTASRAGDGRQPARFQRATASSSALETAVAVAITDDLPRLDDIDWHDFVDGHQDAFAPPAPPAPVDVAREPAVAEHLSTDPLAALDWAISNGPRRDPRTGRRIVEIKGQVGAAATAPVDDTVSIAARGGTRRRPPRTAGERFHARPDRVAMWAFLLGVILILVAAFSAPEADAAMRLIGG